MSATPIKLLNRELSVGDNPITGFPPPSIPMVDFAGTLDEEDPSHSHLVLCWVWERLDMPQFSAATRMLRSLLDDFVSIGDVPFSIIQRLYNAMLLDDTAALMRSMRWQSTQTPGTSEVFPGAALHLDLVEVVSTLHAARASAYASSFDASSRPSIASSNRRMSTGFAGAAAVHERAPTSAPAPAAAITVTSTLKHLQSEKYLKALTPMDILTLHKALLALKVQNNNVFSDPMGYIDEALQPEICRAYNKHFPVALSLTATTEMTRDNFVRFNESPEGNWDQLTAQDKSDFLFRVVLPASIRPANIIAFLKFIVSFYTVNILTLAATDKEGSIEPSNAAMFDNSVAMIEILVLFQRCLAIMTEGYFDTLKERGLSSSLALVFPELYYRSEDARAHGLDDPLSGRASSRTDRHWRGLSGTLETFLVSSRPELQSFAKMSSKVFRESQRDTYKQHPMETSNPLLRLECFVRLAVKSFTVQRDHYGELRDLNATTFSRAIEIPTASIPVYRPRETSALSAGASVYMPPRMSSQVRSPGFSVRAHPRGVVRPYRAASTSSAQLHAIGGAATEGGPPDLERVGPFEDLDCDMSSPYHGTDSEYMAMRAHRDYTDSQEFQGSEEIDPAQDLGGMPSAEGEQSSDWGGTWASQNGHSSPWPDMNESLYAILCAFPATQDVRQTSGGRGDSRSDTRGDTRSHPQLVSFAGKTRLSPYEQKQRYCRLAYMGQCPNSNSPERCLWSHEVRHLRETILYKDQFIAKLTAESTAAKARLASETAKASGSK